MQLLLTIAYSFFFIFLIGKMDFFKLPGISIKLMQSGFILKLLAGIGVGLIYTFYYTDRLTADTFKFFDDSEILFNSLHSKPLDYIRMLTGIGASGPDLQHYYDSMTNWYDTFSPFNDNRTMIRLNSFLRLFSMGHYYVHVVIVCFLSYIGIIAIVRVFTTEYPELTQEIFLTFLLLPSVLFWGSGLLKDALVFFTFGLVLLFFEKMTHKSRFKTGHILMLTMSLFLLMMTKFQVFLICLPLLTAWALTARFKLNALLTFTGVSILFITLILLVSNTIPGWDVINLLVLKQKAFFELAQITDAGSFIPIPLLEPNLLNLATNAPLGFMNCLTRPFITDSGAILNTISAIENSIVVLIGIYCILNIKLHNFKGKILPAFCLFYVLYSFTLIGMITPVLGAMVRYKAHALPFMLAAFIIAAHPSSKKLIQKFIPKSL